MPKKKRGSYRMKLMRLKLKRRKMREEEMKRIQELQIIDGGYVISQEDHEILSRSERRAEYARNYRKNMSEERKERERAIAAWRSAQRRKSMSAEKRAEIREADRLRTALKRKNMSEEEKQAIREYNRQRAAMKRQNRTEEEKLAARETDRRRMAMKRKIGKEQKKQGTAKLRLAQQSPNNLYASVEFPHSTTDNEVPMDIQRFLAISLITGQMPIITIN